MIRNIRIVSDGSIRNTHIFSETGELIRYICSVEIYAEAGETITAKLEYYSPEFDVIIGKPIFKRVNELHPFYPSFDKDTYFLLLNTKL